MAFLQVHFVSGALGLNVSAHVLLPQTPGRAQDKGFPVVWLLHGLSDDHTIWSRLTSIERHAAAIAPGFAIVMPAVDRSFYSDMKNGNRYWTYVSDELPAIMGGMFPLSDRREDTFAAGLSMGGYGALKLALNQPGRFLACASLSGACEMGSHLSDIDMDESFRREMLNIFGSTEEFAKSVNDLSWQAEQAARSDTKPSVYMACGTKDFLYQNNLGFLAHIKKLGLDVKWEETPEREHTWDYWDEKIQVALKWFVELRNKAVDK